ncbi:DnaJ homolog subfamily C member 7 homolog [Durusdinium trenchii]|uniref:DnaJ homolog subfamily C member 7 homolog n=1 Tax=Durusdinium trenchii TaxID=1381693 RepID=A0ABP0R6H8_9DINO
MASPKATMKKETPCVIELDTDDEKPKHRSVDCAALRQQRDQYRRQGDFEKAFKLAEQLVQELPDFDSKLCLAVARLEIGQDQKALEELKSLQVEGREAELQSWLRIARHWAVQPNRKNHYQALGVPIDASAAEVKQAYRKTLLLWHPDKSGGDAARFRAAQEAWEMLGSLGLQDRHASSVAATPGVPVFSRRGEIDGPSNGQGDWRGPAAQVTPCVEFMTVAYYQGHPEVSN